MRTKMSGEENSNLNDAVTNMRAVDKALDEYEAECGLPLAVNPCDKNELDVYFSMKRDHIEKLSSEDCGQIAYRLSQVSFHLQRCINREQSRITWAKAKLDATMASNIHSFDKYMKHEVKVAAIQQTNSYAKKLGDIISYADQRSQRLTFLAASIKHLSEVMLANHRSKSYARAT